MSNRIRYNQHVSNTAGDNESKLVIVKILFLATGFLLTYENLFGVFDDIKLRLLSVIIGGSLMFLGCKDTIQLIFEECFYQPISYKNAIRISKTNANCISPNSLTLQTLNGVTKHRRSTGKKSYNDENSESTQINSFNTDTDIYDPLKIDKLSSEVNISREYFINNDEN